MNAMIGILLGLAILNGVCASCKLLYDVIIKGKLEKALIDRIKHFALKNFDRIKIRDFQPPTKGYRNNSCHWNSYHKTIEDSNRYKMYAVLCVNNNSSIIHFVNKDVVTGKYLDETLGVMGMLNFEYFIIGECSLEGDFIDMNERICELKEWMIKKVFKYKFVADIFIILQNKHGII